MDIKDIVTRYSTSKGWEEAYEDDESIIEVITECGDEVWVDPDIDMHRWYGLQDVVVKLGEHYIAFQKYIITGDMGMCDMDLEYDLSDFSVVQPKTRTVVETYYE